MHARAAVVASGTATVEAALSGHSVRRRLSAGAAHLVLWPPAGQTGHVRHAELIAGKKIVPELIQKDFTAERLQGTECHHPGWARAAADGSCPENGATAPPRQPANETANYCQRNGRRGRY